MVVGGELRYLGGEMMKNIPDILVGVLIHSSLTQGITPKHYVTVTKEA